MYPLYWMTSSHLLRSPFSRPLFISLCLCLSEWANPSSNRHDGLVLLLFWSRTVWDGLGPAVHGVDGCGDRATATAIARPSTHAYLGRGRGPWEMLEVGRGETGHFAPVLVCILEMSALLPSDTTPDKTRAPCPSSLPLAMPNKHNKHTRTRPIRKLSLLLTSRQRQARGNTIAKHYRVQDQDQ